jgi:hypothetical protein
MLSTRHEIGTRRRNGRETEEREEREREKGAEKKKRDLVLPQNSLFILHLLLRLSTRAASFTLSTYSAVTFPRYRGKREKRRNRERMWTTRFFPSLLLLFHTWSAQRPQHPQPPYSLPPTAAHTHIRLSQGQ